MGDLDLLSSRAIIGTYYQTLQQESGKSWINALGMLMNSDQSSETYNFLGQSPAMRQWVGGRNAKGFTANGITIENQHFEATIDILVRHLRRDKSGQVMARIRDLAARTQSHWASLLSTLITAGKSTECYDGQYFFDTDHSEGSSGTQDNDITTDISALPTITHGSVTIPSVEEMQQAILKSIMQIQGFKDDQGEPLNENASSFLVMVPPTLHFVAAKSMALPASGDLNTQGLAQGLSVSVISNPRFTNTDSFHTFRTDGHLKPFILQQETEVQMKIKGAGSEYEFDNDAWQIGVDCWRNVGYGMWQGACLNTLV